MLIYRILGRCWMMFCCVEYEVLCKQNIINILAIKAYSNYINSQ